MAIFMSINTDTSTRNPVFDYVRMSVQISNSNVYVNTESEPADVSQRTIPGVATNKNVNKFWLAKGNVGGTRFNEFKRMGRQLPGEARAMYDGFCGRFSSPHNVSVVVTISGFKDTDVMKFEFERPHMVEIDGVENSSSTIYLKARGTYNFSTKDGSPVKILAISVMNKLELNKTNMTDFEYTTNIANASPDFQFGIYEDSARIEFNSDPTLMTAIESVLSGSEQSMEFVSVKSDGTESVRNEKVWVTDISSDATGVAWNMEFSNFISFLKTMDSEGLSLKEGHTLIDFLNQAIPNGIQYELHNITNEYISSITIPDGMILPQKTFDALTLCCQAGMFNASFYGGKIHLWRIF